jgi:hypothetical protein
MIFRLRFVKRGGHIHCRLFQAKAAGHTWEKNGDLVFDWPGWAAFTALTWDRIEILPEDDEPPRPAPRPEILAAAQRMVAEGGTHDCGEWWTEAGICALCGNLR